jgi:hypothetical protein
MTRDPLRRSRRRFLRTLAAGSAAVAVAAALPVVPAVAAPEAEGPLAATTPAKKPAPRAAAPPAALKKEIQKQKEYLAKALETLRAHVLPAGSEPGFAFRPMRATRRGGKKP